MSMFLLSEFIFLYMCNEVEEGWSSVVFPSTISTDGRQTVSPPFVVSSFATTMVTTHSLDAQLKEIYDKKTSDVRSLKEEGSLFKNTIKNFTKTHSSWAHDQCPILSRVSVLCHDSHSHEPSSTPFLGRSLHPASGAPSWSQQRTRTWKTQNMAGRQLCGQEGHSLPEGLWAYS